MTWADYPLVLTIEHVAEIRGISATTIRRMLRRGRFQPTPLPQVGKTSRLLWSKQELKDWIDGGHRQDPKQRPVKKNVYRIPA